MFSLRRLAMNLPPALASCLEFNLDGTVQSCKLSSENTALFEFTTLLGLFEMVATLEFHPLLSVVLELGYRHHVESERKLLLT